MKAIRVSEFGDADRLRLEEIEKPVPGPGQVLVRVMAAGVNPVDTYIRSGTHSVRPDLPYTPGKDAAGIIEAVGEGVAIPLGTRVYTADSLTGTYAEFCLCNEEQVHALGEGISFEQGAGIFVPYATAYRALFQKAQAKAGETVLIHGASGAVGIAAIQFARRAGLRVIGTAGSEAGIELIKNTGPISLSITQPKGISARSLELPMVRGSISFLRCSRMRTSRRTSVYLRSSDASS